MGAKNETPPAVLSSSEIYVSEFMPNPEGSDEGKEWIEIYNFGNSEANLKGFIFDRLGIKSEDIIYTKDFNEALTKVDEKEIDASFILNPVKIQQMKAVARNGERMPPKTTYFYPKALSGLTVYKIES